MGGAVRVREGLHAIGRPVYCARRKASLVRCREVECDTEARLLRYHPCALSASV